MVARMKVVKPSKMKIGVFKKEVRKNFQKQARKITKDLGKITKTWKGEKPKFTYKTAENPIVKMTIFIGGSEKGVNKWIWNNDGTKPHKIKPVNGTRLFFRSGYKRKTQPRVIGSGSGGSSGPTVVAREVNHPGNKAGEWELTIRDKWEPILQQTTQDAVNTAARKSGHAI